MPRQTSDCHHSSFSSNFESVAAMVIAHPNIAKSSFLSRQSLGHARRTRKRTYNAIDPSSTEVVLKTNMQFNTVWRAVKVGAFFTFHFYRILVTLHCVFLFSRLSSSNVVLCRLRSGDCEIPAGCGQAWRSTLIHLTVHVQAIYSCAPYHWFAY